MALQISYTTKAGVTCDYHKISKIDVEYYPLKKVNMSVAIYKDASAASAGNAPLEVKDYHFQEAEPEAGVDTDTFTGRFQTCQLYAFIH